jgi:hypothetical protein
MFTVILLCVGLDVSQYRESGVSFASKKTIIPLDLQMTLTKLWIKSDPQRHLADVPGGDVRQPLAVYDSRPSDQRDSCVVTPMPTRERSHCPVRTPVSAPLRQSKRAKIRGRVPRGSKFASITDPVASLLDGVTTKEDCFLETTPNDAFLTLAGHCVDGHLINSAPARFLSITGSLRPVPNLHYVAIFKLDDQHGGFRYGGFRSPGPSNSIDQRRNRSRGKPRRFLGKMPIY